MPYPLQDAVDVLDAIAASFNPGRAAVAHGAVTLALHIDPSDAQMVALLAELERYLTAHLDQLHPELCERAGPAASRLRHAIGVH